MRLQAEFDFKDTFAAQGLKIRRLQRGVAGLTALLIFCVVADPVYMGLLEFILLLVFLRARQSMAMPVVECLVVKNKSATALIAGEHHALSAYRLDYFSTWLALVRLTTVAGQTYRCFVFPELLGSVKYRQLIALLKAKNTTLAR